MPDVYQLLSDEHREIEKLLSQYDTAPDDATARAIGEALTAHTELEKRIVYPELRRLVDGGDDLADEAEAEHSAVKLLIARMQATPPEELRPLVEAIAGAIAPHFEQEERTIFPAMREAGVDAEGMGHRLEDARADSRAAP
jgi:hemerythrin superfamily protein